MSMISAFYSGKSILVTGGTGFMGKVLMEKLLRTSPDLKIIYILVRPKAGQTLQQRVFHILNSKHIVKLYTVRSDCMNRNSLSVRGNFLDIQRDLSCPLCQHTGRIREKAIQLNVVATQQLLTMASQMEKLEAFIHMSTAFSNCNLKHIDEVVYSCPVEPNQIIDSLEWLDDSIIEDITPKLIGDRPNTYIYTKALAEILVKQASGNLNRAIIRPSIVGATWQEPFPGWVDNLNGPSGIIISIGKGLIRFLKGTPLAIADIIPVDTVINLTLAAGWYTAVHRPKNTLIYHCTSGTINPCQWREMGFTIMETFNKVPLERPFRVPAIGMASNRLTNKYWDAVAHRGPAMIFDVYLRLTGRKPMMTKLMNRLLKTTSMMEYFISHTWEWSTYNTEVLMLELSPEDHKIFNFDIRPLNWMEYIENYVLGIKMYLLKEDMARVPEAKKQFRRIRNIHYLMNTILFLIAWRLLIARSQIARNVWFFLVHFCYKFLSYFRASITLKA
ncbi:fatty acyl-CoA reductase 2 [Echinops telfairi]|uniref:Fatty acyl-CoA reductase n=1 Tax=Echinops telfairi TaxID=9371 RepID=A0ABM0IHL1_ECHTE|nr:fatty acyl-CoA reductase 2 [Echinops telfairi]